MSTNINNILYIGILLIIVLLICLKSIDLHKNIIENFADDEKQEDGEKKMIDALGKVYNVNDQIKEAGLSNADREDLAEKCKNLGKTDLGSIVSKYSGKVINVEKESNSPAGKTRYIIKWEPLGGKPGGCVTANVDGSYSTPICNHNIDKQLWEIIEVRDAEQFTKLIEDFGGKNRLKMGRPLDETSYPFHIVKATKHDFVLNYEGGGLSVRKLANYDSQKWDVSTESITQDPMPTQNNNKHTSLTPGHNRIGSDRSVNSLGNGKDNDQTNDLGDGVNFNINVDPDLLKQLFQNNIGNDFYNDKDEYTDEYTDEYNDDLYQDPDVAGNNQFKRGLSGDMKSGMLVNREKCSNCGEIPERFIRKDLVKSMCPGCNKIDNVKT
jgi:hypothetical protein